MSSRRRSPHLLEIKSTGSVILLCSPSSLFKVHMEGAFKTQPRLIKKKWATFIKIFQTQLWKQNCRCSALETRITTAALKLLRLKKSEDYKRQQRKRWQPRNQMLFSHQTRAKETFPWNSTLKCTTRSCLRCLKGRLTNSNCQYFRVKIAYCLEIWLEGVRHAKKQHARNNKKRQKSKE